MRDYEELVNILRNCVQSANGLNIQAADAIEELCKDLERSKEWEKFWENEANEALKKFQIAVADKPKWISVEERLPEPFISVLLCVPKLAPFPTVIEGYMSDAGIFHNVRILYDTIVQVTHWMPLPEPPKEDDNDSD